MTIRIVVAEDSALIREGLVRMLEADPEIELADVCDDLPSLLEAIGNTLPDVVLTDIRMPPGNSDEGIRAAALLRESNPETGVVVLSQYAEPEYALALLEGGSDRRAYLLKERIADAAQLLGAVHTVAAGGSVIDAKVVDSLVAARARPLDSPLDALTAREREVLDEMAQGKSNASIAASLVLTERAIEKHVNSIFAKLRLTYEPDVNKRVKAVLLYLAEASA